MGGGVFIKTGNLFAIAILFAEMGLELPVVAVAVDLALLYAVEMVEYVLMDDVEIIDDVVPVFDNALVLDHMLIRATFDDLAVYIPAMVRAMPPASVVVHTIYSVSFEFSVLGI